MGTHTSLVILLFDPQNRLLLRQGESGGPWMPTHFQSRVPSGEVEMAAARQVEIFSGQPAPVTRGFSFSDPEIGRVEVFFARYAGHSPHRDPDQSEANSFSIDELTALSTRTDAVSPLIKAMIPELHSHAVRIGYLDLTDRDYIYRFRTDRQRNRDAYLLDSRARGLYLSPLCEAIKQVKRSRERTSAEPALLDFGAIRYILPSHFGFCLGVQNAIERAYETLGQYPDRRVFMLSELIHNPFVNEDLRMRGLRYLQTDRGVPLPDPESGRLYWDSLTSDDIVIIPAFGATNEDKRRLITRGIAVHAHDATCMLVEKVWKVARTVGHDGYTVIIHGKSEHEETKATFSNTAQNAPALIVRNLDEARRIGRMILETDPALLRQELSFFAGRHTDGFDPTRHLNRIAVVNQTTLLRNETVAIIDYFEGILARKFGPDRIRDHLYGQSRGDTLCYATQVNQDALGKALALKPDRAIVVGGRNSSNTYQLYRLCTRQLGPRAVYIQSERDIHSLDSVDHYHFPANSGDPAGGRTENLTFPAAPEPLTILITGGASCPDGIIQKIIERLNVLVGPGKLRSNEEVLREVTQRFPPGGRIDAG
ncbi:MAG: 4-hydroxy-3-methylbut-2-enyl diphosphate reductase [Opitutaceae bacterium]